MVSLWFPYGCIVHCPWRLWQCLHGGCHSGAGICLTKMSRSITVGARNDVYQSILYQYIIIYLYQLLYLYYINTISIYIYCLYIAILIPMWSNLCGFWWCPTPQPLRPMTGWGPHSPDITTFDQLVFMIKKQCSVDNCTFHITIEKLKIKWCALCFIKLTIVPVYTWCTFAEAPSKNKGTSVKTW